MRRDFDPCIGSTEQDSGAGGSRTQIHRDLLAGMQSDPPAPDPRFQRPLRRCRNIPHHATDFLQVVPTCAKNYRCSDFLPNHSLLRIVASNSTIAAAADKSTAQFWSGDLI